jgi:hypothetical protein
MDRLEAMSVVIAVAETGSISAESRRLKGSIATASRMLPNSNRASKARLQSGPFSGLTETNRRPSYSI